MSDPDAARAEAALREVVTTMVRDFERELERDAITRMDLVVAIPAPINVIVLRLWDRLNAALAPLPVQADAGDLVNLAHNQLRDLVVALRAEVEESEDRERDLHGRREVAEAETRVLTRERDTLQAQVATFREMHETVKAQAEALTRDRDEAVKHLHDTLREAMGNCSTDYTDFRMAVVGAEGWRIRCQTTEARVARLEAALADLSNAFVAMATVADPTPDGALIDDVVWEAAFKVCKRNEPLLTECRDKHLRPGGERG